MLVVGDLIGDHLVLATAVRSLFLITTAAIFASVGLHVHVPRLEYLSAIMGMHHNAGYGHYVQDHYWYDGEALHLHSKYTEVCTNGLLYDSRGLLHYFGFMKQPFQPGDKKTFVHIVNEADTARFESGEVHPVYSTFALARDAEWSGRLFVLEMKEEDEEGIGTGVTVKHHSPALVGQEITFTAVLTEINGNEVVTDYTATVGERVIAEGRQWQKILKKEKLERLLQSL